MLSNKFILIIIVVIVLVMGFAFFPAFNTGIRMLPTNGLNVQFRAIMRLFPYILFFVVLYAAYIVSKRGR